MGTRFLWVLGILLGTALQAAPLNEGFENGAIPDNWTVVDQDNDGYRWEASITYPHTGLYSARVHWNSDGSDDWLITPPLNPVNGDQISFWARSASTTWPEDFQVLVSTTAPVPDSFHDTLATITQVPGVYTQYVFDLSAYAGQTIYVAVRCISVDAYYLHVDDFEGPAMVPPPGKNVTTTQITPPEIVFSTETVPVRVQLKNEGSDATGSFYQVLMVNGTRVDSQRLWLAGGQDTTLILHYTASSSSMGAPMDTLVSFPVGPADSIGSDFSDDTSGVWAPVTPLYTVPFSDDFSSGIRRWARGGTGAWRVRSDTLSLVGDSSMLFDRSESDNRGYSAAWIGLLYESGTGGASFYYRRINLEGNDSLRVLVSTNRGASWDTLFQISGDHDTVWHRHVQDFSGVLDSTRTDTLIYKIMVFANYPYNTDGVFVDSVFADSVVPAFYDIKVDTVLWPQYTISDSLPLLPTYVVRNTGNRSVTYQAHAIIRDMEGSEVYTQTQNITTPLPPGSADTISFPEFYPQSVVPYKFYGWVDLGGSPYTSTDTVDFMAFRYIGNDFLALDLGKYRNTAYRWIRDLQDLGYAGRYCPDTAGLAWPAVKDYKMLWISAGMYPDNWAPSLSHINALRSYLYQGGYAYAEGGDLWGYGPMAPAMDSLFGMLPDSVLDGAYGDTVFSTLHMASNPWMPGMDSVVRQYPGAHPFIDRLTDVPANPGDSLYVAGFAGTPDDLDQFYSMTSYRHYTDTSAYRTTASSMLLGIVDTMSTTKARPTLRIVWSIVHDNFQVPPSQQPIVVLESPDLGIRRFTFAGPHPNPVRNEAWVTFTLPARTPVRLEVYDVAGRRVQVLLDRTLRAGFYRVPLAVQRMTSGVYFLRLEAGRFERVHKFVVTR